MPESAEATDPIEGDGDRQLSRRRLQWPTASIAGAQPGAREIPLSQVVGFWRRAAAVALRRSLPTTRKQFLRDGVALAITFAVFRILLGDSPAATRDLGIQAAWAAAVAAAALAVFLVAFLSELAAAAAYLEARQAMDAEFVRSVVANAAARSLSVSVQTRDGLWLGIAEGRSLLSELESLEAKSIAELFDEPLMARFRERSSAWAESARFWLSPTDIASFDDAVSHGSQPTGRGWPSREAHAIREGLTVLADAYSTSVSVVDRGRKGGNGS